MLTIRENLMETIKGGNPDRFVKQYEYMDFVPDPLMGVYFGNIVPGGEWVNGWGVKMKFPAGLPGPFPFCEGEDKLLKDVTKWKEVVKAPNPVLSPEAWDAAVKHANSVDRKEKFVTAAVFNGMFEKMHYMMGMEDTLINFYEEPEAMHELIDYLTDWEIACAEEMIKYTHPDALFHHDDWGSQTSTFFSPEMFEEFFLPAYKKIYGYWKDNGVEVIIHHSDSYAATLVPYMIEAGIDVYQGAVSDNNIPELIKKYGGKITIQGGLDNGKYDKEDWSREKVRAGLKDLIDAAGTRYLIPALTMGGPETTYPGLYEAVSEIVGELDAEYFKQTHL